MKKILLGLTSLLLFFFLFSQSVLAKDYSIKSTDFVVKLQNDGTADITENRAYDFSATDVPNKQFVEVRVIFPKIAGYSLRQSNQTLVCAWQRQTASSNQSLQNPSRTTF